MNWSIHTRIGIKILKLCFGSVRLLPYLAVMTYISTSHYFNDQIYRFYVLKLPYLVVRELCFTNRRDVLPCSSLFPPFEAQVLIREHELGLRVIDISSRTTKTVREILIPVKKSQMSVRWIRVANPYSRNNGMNPDHAISLEIRCECFPFLSKCFSRFRGLISSVVCL